MVHCFILSMSSYCLLASRVYESNLAVNLVEGPSYLPCGSSLAAYNILPLSFAILMSMYLHVDLLVFILLGVVQST